MKIPFLPLVGILLFGIAFRNAFPLPPLPATPGDLAFTENKGQVFDQYRQARPDVLFSGSTGELTFHIQNNGISYQIRRGDSIYRTDLYWEGMDTQFRTEAKDGLPGFNHYYNVPEGEEPVLQVREYRESCCAACTWGRSPLFFEQRRAEVRIHPSPRSGRARDPDTGRGRETGPFT
ncbi:MAG: hypothetical protein IPJ40_03115 [Saprospirales bacterium]|nr:hypothetical protein [Saprospirales bacterium]